jgi:hypothetical protein
MELHKRRATDFGQAEKRNEFYLMAIKSRRDWFLTREKADFIE